MSDLSGKETPMTVYRNVIRFGHDVLGIASVWSISYLLCQVLSAAILPVCLKDLVAKGRTCLSFLGHFTGSLADTPNGFYLT